MDSLLLLFLVSRKEEKEVCVFFSDRDRQTSDIDFIPFLFSIFLGGGLFRVLVLKQNVKAE